MLKEYTNQVVQNTSVHYPLTNAQAVLEPWLPPASFNQAYTLSTMSYGAEYPFGQFGSSVLAVSPPSFLCTPRLLISRPG